MAASAIEGPCQVRAAENDNLSDLRPAGRGQLIILDAKGGHSLSVCTLDRRSSFVARSVTLVNIEKNIGL